MKDIKIIVACHKPSVLPENALFYPVQVGSALAKKKLQGMVQDDSGENISEKNPMYCELTAQYWAWKNLDADYYGLCHYRRFLCFADVDAPKNVRNQYEAGSLDAFNLKRFGLENEEQMRSVIEANDVVVGELQQMSKLYTPRGNQRTAYKHWTAHNRALIMTEDLEKMLSILDRVAPEVGRSTREYLNGEKFGGFNCFVMKKELFAQMCEIEFKVLSELENAVNLSSYCQQIKRIYGFMGEIISSGFVYHLEKQKTFRVRHVPLVYFNYTDAVPVYDPLNKENSVAVLFDQTTEQNFVFGTLWQSFLDHVETEVHYEAFAAIRNLTPALKNVYLDMAKEYPNVVLHFLPLEQVENMMTDRLENVVPLTPFIPWILPKHQKILVLGPCVLLKKSILPLWNEDVEGFCAAAPADILKRARVNDIYYEIEEKRLSEQMRKPLSYFFAGAMVLNLKKIREAFTQENVYAACYDSKKKTRSSDEILNVLLEDRVKYVGQEWNTMYESNDYLKYQLPYAPNDNYMALLTARKDPAIISYMRDDPWIPQVNEMCGEFWTVAQRLPIYYKYLAYMSYMVSPFEKNHTPIIDRVFPHHGRVRGFLIWLFPNGSMRRRVVKKMLHFFKLQ